MRPERRTLIGVMLALILTPLFAGVLGCVPAFPVPIGDPESGWIDPAVSGMWVSEDDPLDLVIITPWDERTWLVWSFESEIADREECAALERPTEVTEVLDLLADSECLDVEPFLPFRMWLSEHGGRRFLTLDYPVGRYFGSEDFSWLVLRISRADGKYLSLHWLDGDDPGFAELPRTREAYEEYLAAHADDEELLEGGLEYVRVPDPEAARLFGGSGN